MFEQMNEAKGLELETKFAPAYRASKEKVQEDLIQIQNSNNIENVIDALPYIAAILNEHRQIVFANKVLLDTLKLDIIEQIITKRPGEALHCINSEKEKGGCGTSEHCKYCGAINSILKSQQYNEAYTDECRVFSQHNGQMEAFDFKVSSAPLIINNRKFTIFTLVDISAEKRKQALEKIFFHDMINKAGSLQGFIRLIKENTAHSGVQKYINIVDEITSELIQEIVNQRELSAAESGELNVQPSSHSTDEIVRASVNHIIKHEVIQERSISIDENLVSTIFETDNVILKRVLLNMLKNALEASEHDGKVTIGCDEHITDVAFWVQNETYMPRNIQLQVFQRSFSTKGKGRGLGTYSMKLLGEKFLKGKVFFESNKENGTIFTIRLPKKYS